MNWKQDTDFSQIAEGGPWTITVDCDRNDDTDWGFTVELAGCNELETHGDRRKSVVIHCTNRGEFDSEDAVKQAAGSFVNELARGLLAILGNEPDAS